MNRIGLAVSVALAGGLAAALSAQPRFANSGTDQKTIQSIRVTVIGCVASGGEAGHYRLTNAFLSGDDVPATAGTEAKTGSGQDLSFDNSSSFDLLGGNLKAHMGHKVEVTGITSDTKLNKSASLNSAIGSSTQERATLTVSLVKMIAAKCP